MKIIIIKKKWLKTIIIITLLILAILLYRTLNIKDDNAEQTCMLPSTTRIIVIDPGHGGMDPGAVSKTGILEKDINLNIALYLRAYLEQSGSIVIMTREGDKGLYSDKGSVKDKKREDLKKRKQIVRDSNGDLFITIHLNSFPQTQYYGAQTFYPQNNPQGKIAAELIQKELIDILDKDNKREALLKEDVYIIKDLEISAILVECGFLSNTKEAELLANIDYQKKIAWALYVGIQRYFEENS